MTRGAGYPNDSPDGRDSARPPIASIVGAAVSALGIVVLFGWAAGVPSIQTVFVGLESMKPNTAAALAAAGAALVLAAVGSSSMAKSLAMVFGGVAATIGGLTLVEYAAGWDIGIDRVLFPLLPGTSEFSSSPRMALATAVMVMLLGLAVGTAQARGRGVFVSQVSSLLALAVAGLALVGYLYGIAALYRFAAYGSVALHTAAASAGLALGVLLLHPGRGVLQPIASPLAGGAMARRLLPLAIVAPITIGWLRLEGERAGLYGTEFGLAVVITSTIAVFGLAIWVLAGSLNKADRERERAVEARERLEAQLAQAQRLESVGRLAGGIAHDFNNILNVIAGYTEILLDRFRSTNDRRAELEAIADAAARAAKLVRQLMVFSRQQVQALEVVDLNAVVTDIEPLLRRLIGEDVTIVWRPSPDLPTIEADRSQLGQVIVNLAVNARDAMPRGGRLMIETATVELDAEYAREHAEVTPGSFVLLSVADTGSGMDDATRARIFEPFYTTKEPGKGTGLGLATVYGIVRQSRGHVWVYSEPGRGTVFKVYFPRTDKAVQPEPQETVHTLERIGSGTIMVAEDEPSLRELLRVMLERLGYDVVSAADPGEAIELAGRTEIDLLITDVIMPGGSGLELAETLRRRAPALRVVFMSGYTAGSLESHGAITDGDQFLQKPFTAGSLSRAVRQALGDTPDHRSSSS